MATCSKAGPPIGLLPLPKKKLVALPTSSLPVSPLHQHAEPHLHHYPRPESNELLDRLGPDLQRFRLLPKSCLSRRPPPARPLTYHCASPLGAVRGRLRHGGHTHTASGSLQSGKEKREERSAPGPRLGSPASPPCASSPARPAGTPTLSRVRFSPAPLQRTPPDAPAVAGKYLRGTAKSKSRVSRKTGEKAGLGNKTQRSRPNATGAALLPARKCPFHFRGEGAGRRRDARRGALRPDGKCSFSRFGFPSPAHLLAL